MPHTILQKSPTSLQNILADAVEVCSGSRQLLKILNRLGCTSSSDTHDRLVTQYAEARRQESIWDVMSKQVFTIASVDNFDVLKSYSAVYCGGQNRSYHKTIIQLVQPDSSILYPNQPFISTQERANMVTELAGGAAAMPLPLDNILTRRRSSSPENFPHKLGKQCPKRMRTLAARNLTKTDNELFTSHQYRCTLSSFVVPALINKDQLVE